MLFFNLFILAIKRKNCLIGNIDIMNSFLTSVTVFLLLAVVALSYQFNIFNAKALTSWLMGVAKVSSFDVRDLAKTPYNNFTDCEREVVYKQEQFAIPENKWKMEWKCYKAWAESEIFFLKDFNQFPKQKQPHSLGSVSYFEVKRECWNCDKQLIYPTWTISLYWEIFPNRFE